MKIQWSCTTMAQGEGSHGVAVGGSTGEGHTLSRDEFKILLSWRVKVWVLTFLGSRIVNSTDEAIERGKIARDQGADALQVTLALSLNQTTKRWFSIFGKFVMRPECLLIYNVVPWTYLSPELLAESCEKFRELRCQAECGDLKLMADLLEMSQSEDLIFSAVDALLYPSFILVAMGALLQFLLRFQDIRWNFGWC